MGVADMRHGDEGRSGRCGGEKTSSCEFLLGHLISFPWLERGGHPSCCSVSTVGQCLGSHSASLAPEEPTPDSSRSSVGIAWQRVLSCRFFTSVKPEFPAASVSDLVDLHAHAEESVGLAC